MRIEKIALSVAALLMVLALDVPPSMAQPYPFCRSSESGQGDCRYNSLEQCQAALAGVAGYCQPNYFLPPAGPAAQPRRARRS